MENYNDRLKELQAQVHRYAHLSSVLETLRGQRTALLEKTDRLKNEMQAEEADVTRLEGRSLAALFYTVIGQREEKLDKERVEARAAAVRYDAAACELAAVEEDIARYEKEMTTLKRAEARYKSLLAEKAAALRASGTAEAEEILRLDGEILRAERRLFEIEEALTEGRRAKSTAESVLTALDDAQGFGTWDLVGGGLLADMGKYEALDRAQAQVESLQVQLRRFRTELADVTVTADLQVRVDSFLRFADYFFDGLFADWTVLEQIGSSIDRVRDTVRSIDTVLDRLTVMEKSARGDAAGLTARRDALIVDAPM